MDTNTFVQWVTVIKENIMAGDMLLFMAILTGIFFTLYLLIWFTSCVRAIIDAVACLISFGKIVPVEEKQEKKEPSPLAKFFIKLGKMPLPLPPKKEKQQIKND